MSIYKDIRESANLSQCKLSKLSGVSRATIYDIETRGNSPRPDTLDKLAKTLSEFTDLAYVAGLFDRSSTITITRNKAGRTNTSIRPHYLARVVFNSKHRILCEIVKTILDCGNVCPVSSKTFEGFSFYAHSKDAGKALEKLLPYLKLKRAKALVLLAFRAELMKNKRKRKESLWYFREDLDWDLIGKDYEFYYNKIREV